MDQSGRLVDCRLSERRDMSAPKQFFKEALEMSGDAPDRVTTDKEVSYPRAIREDLGVRFRYVTAQLVKSREVFYFTTRLFYLFALTSIDLHFGHTPFIR